MKNLIKSLFNFIGYLSSYIYTFSLRGYLSEICFFIYTGWIRRLFKRMEGDIHGKIVIHGGKSISVGKNTNIYERVILDAILTGVNGESYTPEITIGIDTIIQRDVQITASNKVIIGNHVDIAARTLITDTVHGDFSPTSFTFNNGSDIPDVFLKNARTRDYVSKGPVLIEDNVHIGMNCIILPGVTIGHNSVVSAGTIVNKNVPPYSIVSGNPCKVMTFS